MSLDRIDLRMALAAVTYYKRAFVLIKEPVPPAADRLERNLEQALSADSQEKDTHQERWITTAEFAKRMGCSQRTACRRAKEIGQKFGQVWRIPLSALPAEEETESAA